MNNKTLKSIILATAIAATGCQHQAPTQSGFAWHVASLPGRGTVATAECGKGSENYSAFFDYDGDGKYEMNNRTFYSSSEGRWMQGPGFRLYHPLTLDDLGQPCR